MPQPGPLDAPITGLFRSSWHPRKAVTVLWRRVETLSPEAYAELLEWAHAAGGEAAWPHLAAMAVNEVNVDAQAVVAELTRLLAHAPPPAVAEQATLLRDLIWEASDPNSDWLTWRPCRVCGRRWATTEFEGLTACPRHTNTAALVAHLTEEMARYQGMVDHGARIASLSNGAAAPASNGHEPAGAEPTALVALPAPEVERLPALAVEAAVEAPAGGEALAGAVGGEAARPDDG